MEQAAAACLAANAQRCFWYDTATDDWSASWPRGGEIRFSADRGIAGEVVRTGQAIHVPDAYADARFWNPEIDRRTGFRTHNLLSFPLLGMDNRTVGVLQVLNKRSGDFTAWDREVVQALGAQVGVAVQRQMLMGCPCRQAAACSATRTLPARFSRACCPLRLPRCAGFDVTGWNRPADETGGDCFDHLRLPGGQLALTLADATGHGIGPASS